MYFSGSSVHLTVSRGSGGGVLQHWCRGGGGNGGVPSEVAVRDRGRCGIGAIGAPIAVAPVAAQGVSESQAGELQGRGGGRVVSAVGESLDRGGGVAGVGQALDRGGGVAGEGQALDLGGSRMAQSQAHGVRRSSNSMGGSCYFFDLFFFILFVNFLIKSY